jgi:hypothetical protein
MNKMHDYAKKNCCRKNTGKYHFVRESPTDEESSQKTIAEVLKKTN